MQQVSQSYRSGELSLVDVPMPSPHPDAVFVSTHASLVSVGTERYMLDLAKKSLAGKALARPDLVKQVLDKVRTDGLAETVRQVQGRLDAPVPLGYSAAGVVVDVGAGVAGFCPGDRVACAGSGIASHAELLRVPQTLAVKIPDVVGFEAAAFVALGGIALHAVRMAKVALGERVAVLGLGLLGQLAVQMLHAAGCRVLGLDIVPAKVQMALEHGARDGAVIGQDDIEAQVSAFSRGRGVDAVLILAGAESNGPIELAAAIVAERGRIVAPGLVGLDLPRKRFYEKEIAFTVSRAWGPGLYDPDYEVGKLDYPQPYVRWTAQRNMAHFLEMVADDRVAVDHLITHRFPLDKAVDAYAMILAGKEPAIGVILHYPGQPDLARTPRDPVRIGLVGAGLFAKGTLLPALKAVQGATLHGMATATGINGEHLARKYDMAYCTTDAGELLHDPEIDLVMVLTRHGSHAGYVCKALAAGKHVFVEKPLALDEAQLQQVADAYRSSPGQLMVGFNRRFAPATVFAAKRLAHAPRPLMVTVRANVGHIPHDSWVYDPEQGGSNLVGEVCHFVDLVQTLTEASPVQVSAQTVHRNGDAAAPEDNVVVTLTMGDGSVGTIVYTTLGDKSMGRERVEVYGGGAVCVIDNFRTARWSQGGKRRRMGHFWGGVDRGHRAEMQALVDALRQGRPFPVPFESYLATTRATFAALASLERGQPVALES